MTKEEFIEFHLSKGWSANDDMDEVSKTTKLGAELYWKVEDKDASLHHLTTYSDCNEYYKLLQTVELKDCSVNNDNKLSLGRHHIENVCLIDERFASSN